MPRGSGQHWSGGQEGFRGSSIAKKGLIILYSTKLQGATKCIAVHLAVKDCEANNGWLYIYY